MINNIRKSMILLLIMIVLCISVIIASARDDRLSKADLNIDKEEVKEHLIIEPILNIKKERENGKVGEEKITPYVNMENDPEHIEDEYKESLVIFGNQASKDGSNDFAKLPALIFLAIASLFTIVLVCFIKRN